MASRAASFVLLSVIGAGLGACADKSPMASDANLPPNNRYKTEIVDTLRTIFSKNDTTSVSNALLSEPALRSVGGEQRYIACVRYAAHYADLQMTTTTERAAYFFGGHVNQLIEAGKDDCANAAYKPFPELNALCLGRGCR
jgi:hypothetical protein